ncbi:cellulose binding domain-containing protein [Streptomyces sp. bgisy100]|uniref:glycoside hydrolase family 18 protein n=1 Tax=Streptomyces sp. bgisy100 TaxID=3413783 RepID=UPI003D716B15
MSRTHRRGPSRGTKVGVAAVAAGAVAGGALALAGTAQATTVGAAYSRTSGWDAGYTAQYVITNDADTALRDWTLEFDLPAGTKLGSLWNGTPRTDGRHITVRPAGWNRTIAPGRSVTVGFVASGARAADPRGCRINEVTCSVADGTPAGPSGRPTRTERPAPAPRPSRKPAAEPSRSAGPTRTATPAPSPSRTSRPGSGTPSAAAFAPYADTSLFPAHDLLGTVRKTGVKEHTLAFVTSGGGCTPKWGGVTDLTGNPVAAQIGDLRAAGGDVRVSFGGATGTELGVACSSPAELAAAYGKVVDAFGLTKVDFDIEGGALPDRAASTRRARAIAELQREHPGLDVSFTLPVLPSGLTQDGVDLVADARRNGVAVSTVNIMAMDYGPAFTGDMGQYAIDAATATQAQLRSVLGRSEAKAWRTVAVTPMIGVNDVPGEVFTEEDAAQLVRFAEDRKLGGLSMWSSTRDKPCPGGPKNTADATCSSLTQDEFAFTRALNRYRG